MIASPEFCRFADPEALAHALAETVSRQLRATLARENNATLVVPGGRTPVAFFNQLSHAALDWNRVFVTLTDERWVDLCDTASNERLLREQLLRNAAVSAQLVGLRGDSAAGEAGAISGATLAWQRLAVLERPFDVVVLGMGEDGHFASLFPDDPQSIRGLDLTQPPGCVVVHAPAAPALRLSLNISALLQCRLLLLLVTGERKWQLLHQEQDPATSRQLPVRQLLMQRRTPLAVYWSP